MKKLVFALLVALQSLLGGQASAGVCVSGDYASYVALGPTGCTIGDFVFSDFTLQGVSAGATDFTLQVVVLGGPVVGLEFDPSVPSATESRVGASSVTVPSGTIYESKVAYIVSNTIAGIRSAGLSFTGSQTTGDGNVSVVEDLCAGGPFGDPNDPGTCKGTALTQSIVNIGGVPDPASVLNFLPVKSLAVVTDIVVDGGTNGTASLTSVSNTFTAAAAVPEPAPLLLIAAGLLACLGRRRTRRRPAR